VFERGVGTYDRYTPEYLFDGCGEGFRRVVGFCRSETDQLGAGERKRCCDKNIAEAFKTIVKGSWVGPVLSSYVSAILRATAVDDCAENA